MHDNVMQLVCMVSGTESAQKSHQVLGHLSCCEKTARESSPETGVEQFHDLETSTTWIHKHLVDD